MLGQADYFIAYSNGKSAARVGRGIEPRGVHRFAHPGQNLVPGPDPIGVRTHFDPAEACVLHLSGTNSEESAHVKLGAYHTLHLELNRNFTVEKECWDAVVLERLPDRARSVGGVGETRPGGGGRASGGTGMDPAPATGETAEPETPCCWRICCSCCST